MEKITCGVILLFTLISLGFSIQYEEGDGETLNLNMSMVALFNTCETHHKAKCMGILIDETYILTAAHCVYGSACLKAQLGQGKYGSEADKQRDIVKAHIHPFYVHGSPSPDYDVAVLQIQNFSSNVEIGFHFPNSEPNSNSKIEIGGWNTEMEFQLLQGNLLDKKTCQSMHNSIVITSRLFCITHPLYSTIGGYPVFSYLNGKYYIIGVASRRGQNQATASLFANIYNSEISSFVESYFNSTTI